MKSAVMLETKDVKEILALFFGIRIEDVTPNRYSFSVAGITADEIERKIKDAKLDALRDRAD